MERDLSEDINPMAGVANLADVMLVFACGLMLALITFWNVDVAKGTNASVPVEQGQEITDVSGLDKDSGKPIANENDLQEYGKVYRDPNTGKLYLVTGEN